MVEGWDWRKEWLRGVAGWIEKVKDDDLPVVGDGIWEEVVVGWCLVL